MWPQYGSHLQHGRGCPKQNRITFGSIYVKLPSSCQTLHRNSCGPTSVNHRRMEDHTLVAIVVFFGNGEPFHVSLSVEMVFVLLLSSTRIHEVVVLICYKLQHATWSWGNMSKNFSLKPDISLSFLLDIISINDICIYGCIALTVVFIL
ncbi:ABH_G0027120.mRNA.1.CDS.1 [Saccharomyces cerevisiae]|nr:ABH_G0027120.mRNA.1.CDS.1 [Saccharomyces cerevisiae]CAI6698684.1 ABH_G0027120.mRNA.1.CDS.1 [Saccharomyces cerevisiae]